MSTLIGTIVLIIAAIIIVIIIFAIGTLSQFIADKVLKCNTPPEPNIFTFYMEVRVRASEAYEHQIHSYTSYIDFYESLNNTIMKDHVELLFVVYGEYLSSHTATEELRDLGASIPFSNIYCSCNCGYEAKFEIDPDVKYPKLISQRLF